MSLTITGVPAAAATDFPAPSQPTELQVLDFAAILKNSPTSGMPELANPTVLASEVFNHLRGFVQRAHYYENLKFPPSETTDDGNITLASADGGGLAQLPGALARDNSALADLAPAGGGGATSQPASGNTRADLQNPLSDDLRKSLADLHRMTEYCLATLNFSVEATVVGGGVAQGVRSVNTLLKAQ
jgi:hypothetical protein